MARRVKKDHDRLMYEGIAGSYINFYVGADGYVRASGCSRLRLTRPQVLEMVKWLTEAAKARKTTRKVT